LNSDLAPPGQPLSLDLDLLARFFGCAVALVERGGRVLQVGGRTYGPDALRPGSSLTAIVQSAEPLRYLQTSRREAGAPVPARLEIEGQGFEVWTQPLPSDPGVLLMRFVAAEASAHAVLRERLNQELATSEERYRTLVEHSPLLMCRINQAHEIDYFNTAFRTAFSDLSIEIGSPIEALVAQVALGPLFAAPLHEAFATSEPQDLLGFQLSGTPQLVSIDFRFVPELDVRRRVSSVLCIGMDVTRRVLSERRLAVLATTDALTGLPNRTLFVDRLQTALRHLKRSGASVAVLFIDLDDFKSVNDSAGHEQGDRLLRTMADRLTVAVRDEDTVARLGGDEFVILAEDLSLEGAFALGERVRAALAEQVYDRWSLSASVGVAWSDHIVPASDLMRDADIAMYQAKREGRDRVVAFQEQMQHVATRRARIEHELVDALSRAELRLHFQPILDVPSGRTVAAEALVRWERPDHGLVPPEDFLPVATESTLIGSVGTWVMREALDHLRAWKTQGLVSEDFRLHVNVAAIQLSDDRFARQLIDLLQDAGELRESILLEITEQMLPDDHLRVLPAALDRIARWGMRLALDDFGTGSSSLSHLRHYPIAAVKIDRSFVERMDESTGDLEIVRAVISLCKSLGIQGIAEGVENNAQSAMLLALGCREHQGFLFGRPMPAEEFVRLLNPQLDPAATEAITGLRET